MNNLHICFNLTLYMHLIIEWYLDYSDLVGLKPHFIYLENDTYLNCFLDVLTLLGFLWVRVMHYTVSDDHKHDCFRISGSKRILHECNQDLSRWFCERKSNIPC